MPENSNGADVAALTKRLGDLEVQLQKVKDRAIGDRNDKDAFAHTLPGEIEVIQEEVAAIKAIVEGWKGTLNKGVTGFVMALIVGAAGFILARLTGGA